MNRCRHHQRRRPTGARRRESGSVLVLVLFVLAVLSLTAVSLAHRTALQRRTMSNRIHMIQMRAAAESTAASVLHALAANRNGFDHAGEAWSLFNTPAATAGDADGDGATTVHCRVVDEQSKLNVHAVSRDTLDALGMSAMQRDGLLDWIDEDEIARAEGAETDFYRRRTPAYRAKNAPLETVDELRAIRGFGSTADRDADHWVQRLTPFGDGRININTAPRDVLETIPVRRQAIDQILSFRAFDPAAGGDVAEHAFRDDDDILRLQGLSDADRSVLLTMATYRSRHFRMEVEARRARSAVRYRITAVVHSDRGKVQVLQWLTHP